RGLFIIQSLMDETHYLRGRGENRLVMRKSQSQYAKDHRSEENVEKRLALSEQAIGTMAKELCFRSEELAAIFRCTSELGRTNDFASFSRRLLKDLVHIAEADWFVFRWLDKEGLRLITFH